MSTPNSPLASHSHKLLILSPAIEGLLGGWSAMMSAKTAYIADCTSPGSRSRIFSRFTGVVSAGLALGPTIGAWLIRHPLDFLKVGKGERTIMCLEPLTERRSGDHPLQSVNSVFWVAIACTLINFILVSLVLPESLPASRRAANRKGKNRAIISHDCNNNGNF